MKTVVLMRVSTDHQETEAQRNAINKYVKDNRIFVSEWIEEKDISGFKVPISEREGLNKIKDYAINKELDKLIVFNLDRIGRQTEALGYISFLNQLGVKILSVTEGEIDAYNINNQLLTYIKLWQAQNESIKTGLRVKAGKNAKNEKGGFNGGTPAFGYSYNKLYKKLEVNEEEAEIVRLIFKLYLECGVNNISKILEDKGLELRGNKKWYKQTIMTIIRNPIYIGKQQYGKWANGNRRDYDNMKMQPYNSELQIIDNAIWEKAQEIREHRTTLAGTYTKDVTKSNVLLNSLLYHVCEDGNVRKLYVDYSYRKNGTKDLIFKCLWCKDHKSKNKKSYGGKKLTEKIEQEIIHTIENLNLKDLKEYVKKKKNTSLKELNKKLKNIDKEIERQNKILNNATKELEKIFLEESKLSMEIVNTMIENSKKKISEFNSEKINLENEKLSIENKIDNSIKLFKKYSDFKNIYENADIKNKKLILQEVLEKVIIDEKGCININLNLI